MAAKSNQDVMDALKTVDKMNQAVQDLSKDCQCELTLFTNSGNLQPLTGQFNSNCDAFIGSNGYYGSWGAVIGETLIAARQENPAYEVFFADSTTNIDGVTTLCPQWTRLSEEQRVNFWVWTFAAISQAESSCDPGAVANGINGKIAVGLTQLERSRQYRYWRSRDANGNGYCDVDTVQSVDNNLKCALDIMLGHLTGVYRQPPSVIGNSYWQELRGSNRKIARMISEFQLCHAEEQI